MVTRSAGLPSGRTDTLPSSLSPHQRWFGVQSSLRPSVIPPVQAFKSRLRPSGRPLGRFAGATMGREGLDGSVPEQSF